MEEKFKQIKDEIDKARNILILTHKAPDGDALGSVLALNLYLKREEKTTYIYVPAAPRFLSFLPCYNETQKKFFPQKFNFLSLAKNKDFDLIFALDYADKKRIELSQGITELLPQRVITIDHHLSGERIGKIKLIETRVSSTAEILYYFFKFLKIKIDKNLATCLLTGILTDTGGFSRENQDTKKLREIISELILAGGELFKIMASYQYIDFKRINALAKLLERIKRDEDLDLIYSLLLLSDFEKEEIDLSEPPIFPDFLSRIGDASVYLFLAEQKKGKVKGSIRIPPVPKIKINAAQLAEKFGGGGHREASGFTAKGTIEEVLERIKEELKKEMK